MDVIYIYISNNIVEYAVIYYRKSQIHTAQLKLLLLFFKYFPLFLAASSKLIIVFGEISKNSLFA